MGRLFCDTVFSHVTRKCRDHFNTPQFTIRQ